MDSGDFLEPKPDVIDLRAKDRWEAIDALVEHLPKPITGVPINSE